MKVGVSEYRLILMYFNEWTLESVQEVVETANFNENPGPYRFLLLAVT
jgi:hypothetical protein